eukprot:scaffold4.g4822.t1
MAAPPPGAAASLSEAAALRGEALKQALAIAIVSRRRRDATVAQLERRNAELERLLAAAIPPAPLARLADAVLPAREPQLQPPQPQPALASQQQTPTAGDAVAGALEAQIASLAMWSRAAGAAGGDEGAQFVAALQQYLLAKDAAAAFAAAAGAAGDKAAAAPAVPATVRLLERTPAGAVLELLSDLLAAVGGVAEGEARLRPASSAAGAVGEALPPSALEHLSASACALLAALANQPGEAACEDDFLALQGFASSLLRAAAGPSAAPPLEEAASPDGPRDAAAAPHLPPRQPGAAASAAARAELAQRMLGTLCQHGGTGMVVLGCAATAAQATMARLVDVVAGEALAPAPPTTQLSQAAGGGAASQRGFPGASAAGGDGGEAEQEEARLARAFGLVAQSLQQGLRALPGWVAELGGCDGEFMQGVAAAVMAAGDACKLVSLSHPGVARQMQRVSAQLLGSLHHISRLEDEQAQQAQQHIGD